MTTAFVLSGGGDPQPWVGRPLGPGEATSGRPPQRGPADPR